MRITRISIIVRLCVVCVTIHWISINLINYYRESREMWRKKLFPFDVIYNNFGGFALALAKGSSRCLFVCENSVIIELLRDGRAICNHFQHKLYFIFDVLLQWWLQEWQKICHKSHRAFEPNYSSLLLDFNNLSFITTFILHLLQWILL